MDADLRADVSQSLHQFLAESLVLTGLPWESGDKVDIYFFEFPAVPRQMGDCPLHSGYIVLSVHGLEHALTSRLSTDGEIGGIRVLVDKLRQLRGDVFGSHLA